jgi:hypothetical protein
MRDARFAGAGGAELDLAILQHLGPAERIELDRMHHDV